MNSLVESARKVERELSAEKGPFSLFALFLRDDAPGKWDLVVSAPWLGDRGAALKLISAKVKQLFAPVELLAISRIVVVEPDAPEVQAINRSHPVERSTVEVRDDTFFGLAMRRAHILASSENAARVAQPATSGALHRPRRKAARR